MRTLVQVNGEWVWIDEDKEFVWKDWSGTEHIATFAEMGIEED